MLLIIYLGYVRVNWPNSVEQALFHIHLYLYNVYIIMLDFCVGAERLTMDALVFFKNTCMRVGGAVSVVRKEPILYP